MAICSERLAPFQSHCERSMAICSERLAPFQSQCERSVAISSAWKTRLGMVSPETDCHVDTLPAMQDKFGKASPSLR